MTELAIQLPLNSKWIICDLEDTIYNKKTLNSIQKFYLPDEVSMNVLGKVLDTSYPCIELLLMICNNKIYGYDGEELHMLTLTLKDFIKNGFKNPPIASYYEGEAFKDMTEEDWNNVKQSEIGQKLDAEHKNLVLSFNPCTTLGIF